jgi:hypothetical protein
MDLSTPAARRLASAIRHALPLTLGIVLAGCVVAPPRSVTITASEPGNAIRVNLAPPPARIETLPPPPAPNWYWAPGHWRWDGQRYDWQPGHWVEPRINEEFVPAHWSQAGGEWVFHPGHWRAETPRPSAATVIVNTAPPPPRIEVMTAPPRPAMFWVAGHWRWEHGAYVWIDGHWEGHRGDAHWVPAHWVPAGGQWRYVEGHWNRD